jgi:hypothetical protein
MKPEIDIETKQFQEALRRLARDTGKSFRHVVDQNARLVAKNLAFQTQPFGETNAAKKTGEGAVMRDIGSVYSSASKIFKQLKAQSIDQAKGFYAAVKNGDYALAEDILKRSGLRDRNAEVGEFDSSHHRQSRNKRGRVSRNRAALITPSGKEIRAYQAEVAKRVGFAKGAWIAAGQQLGRLSRVPAWMRRHAGSGQGTGTRKGGENNPSASMNNNVGYVSGILTPAQISEALRLQREKMEAHINHVVSSNAKKAGFKVTGNTGKPPEQP